MIDIKKVYVNTPAGSKELVFDVDNIIAPPIPDPESKSFQFAEVPEQAFAVGYKDEEGIEGGDNMNLFHLEPANLHPTGFMPWEGRAPFTPNLKCDLIVESGMALPSGVYYNKNTGYLSYTGTPLTEEDINEIAQCHFVQVETGLVSNTFNIKLLKPTLVWSNADGRSLETAVNSEFGKNALAENVVVVLDGTYQDYAIRDLGNGYTNMFMNKGNAYLIGDPGAMPCLSGNKDDWTIADGYDPVMSNYGDRLLLRCNGTPHFMMKNINLRFAEIAHGGREYVTYNKVKMHTYAFAKSTLEYGGYLYASNPLNPKWFLTNFETYWIGAGGLQHPIYGHSVLENSTDPKGSEMTIHLNNYKSYETKAPTQASGGIGYKDISKNVHIRNSYISKTKDGTNSTMSKASGSQLISLHSMQRVVMFNNDINFCYKGSPHCLTFQSRRLHVARGGIHPPYFSWPALVAGGTTIDKKVGAGAWENFAGSDSYSGDWQAVKSNEFHGDNDTNDYTATGEQGDTNPHPTRTPVNAPFWENLGDISDPANADNCFHKYVSHCRFTLIEDPGRDLAATLVASRTTAPSVVAEGVDAYIWLPAPPNWKERTWLFYGNNTFTGFNQQSNQVRYQTDFPEPNTQIRYPYAPDVVEATKDNYTYFGGDILDGAGNTTPVPNYFKL